MKNLVGGVHTNRLAMERLSACMSGFLIGSSDKNSTVKMNESDTATATDAAVNCSHKGGRLMETSVRDVHPHFWRGRSYSEKAMRRDRWESLWQRLCRPLNDWRFYEERGVLWNG